MAPASIALEPTAGNVHGLGPVKPPIPARDSSVEGLVARFESLQRKPDSPIRAIHRLPAREAR